MQQLLRFSVSGVLGIIITLSLFIGMLNLITQKQKATKSNDLNVSFSYLKEYEPPKERERKKKEEPKQETTPQPPMAVPMNLDPSPEAPTAIAMGTKAVSDFGVLKGLNFNVPGGPVSDGFGAGLGGLKSGFAPVYPPGPLMKNQEGWVEVMITVNEFGQVSDVVVLNAEPRRVFDKATIQAVRKWQFHPKVVDGQAVSYQVTQTVEFSINQQ